MTGFVRLLPRITVAKPWGVDRLPPPFRGESDERIGEIWFDPPEELSDILVKYLFTSENLSVQVHPDDAQAPVGSLGKEECWLVLGADPGAKLAIGFRETVDREKMRAAALDGSIEDLLEWHQVREGDFFYLPAGTVHAIGAGVTILEIQQNSDITYRLYDYGRPRELHLDEGVAVASGERYEDRCKKHLSLDRSQTIVDGPKFRVDLLVGDATENLIGDLQRHPVQAVLISGEITIDGTDIAVGTSVLLQNVGRVHASSSTHLIIVSSSE